MEKLHVYDPNITKLFAEEFAELQRQAEEKRDEAVEKGPEAETSESEDVKGAVCVGNGNFFRNMSIMCRFSARYGSTVI